MSREIESGGVRRKSESVIFGFEFDLTYYVYMYMEQSNR